MWWSLSASVGGASEEEAEAFEALRSRYHIVSREACVAFASQFASEGGGGCSCPPRCHHGRSRSTRPRRRLFPARSNQSRPCRGVDASVVVGFLFGIAFDLSGDGVTTGPTRCGRSVSWISPSEVGQLEARGKRRGEWGGQMGMDQRPTCRCSYSAGGKRFRCFHYPRFDAFAYRVRHAETGQGLLNTCPTTSTG